MGRRPGYWKERRAKGLVKPWPETPEQREHRNAWQREHRKVTKEKQAAYRRKAQIKGVRWNNHLKCIYGITSADYEKMVEKQEGRCAICRTVPTRDASKCRLKVRSKFLYVDHCHKTGKIRGLLCHRCNLLVGYIDNTEPLVLEAARKWVENDGRYVL